MSGIGLYLLTLNFSEGPTWHSPSGLPVYVSGAGEGKGGEGAQAGLKGEPTWAVQVVAADPTAGTAPSSSHGGQIGWGWGAVGCGSSPLLDSWHVAQRYSCPQRNQKAGLVHEIPQFLNTGITSNITF